MAGDWIKIRTDLYEDQGVMNLSDILGTDDPTTVGLLVRFWSWADKQTSDGTNIAITSARLDRLIGRDGFAEGMRQIGWLSGRDGSLSLPRFERHNGSSAKARALEAEAKRLRRANEKLSDNASDKCPTERPVNVRPEKRREEVLEEREKGGPRRPTIEQARSAGSNLGIVQSVVDEWWNAREASEWIRGTGGGGTTPVGSNWQADLKTWSTKAAPLGKYAGPNGFSARSKSNPPTTDLIP